jgi:hypothetical protein
VRGLSYAPANDPADNSAASEGYELRKASMQKQESPAGYDCDRAARQVRGERASHAPHSLGNHGNSGEHQTVKHGFHPRARDDWAKNREQIHEKC